MPNTGLQVSASTPNLIPADEMTTLVPATQAQSIAATAEDAIQLKAVAYLINNAANTGQYRAKYNDELRPYVVQQLKSNGYTIRYTGNVYNVEHDCIISWEPAAENNEG